MKPEQWQQAREVLADALELKPEDRPAFLDRACSSDESLRREVERLLSYSDEARSGFLQSSAFRIGLTPGAKLGEYEIVRLLGSGGMGEVYQARDTRLGREVAIKVLPSVLSHDHDRLRRFEQEARAAAALNHPNILAVHQMGMHEGAPYLVSELLEGSTLRGLLLRGPLPVRKTIDYGVQIARGLAAAHEKGIAHRDLKPENLFVTKDGRVKILDFGLAKLTQSQTVSDQSTPTVSVGTEPGVVMGTVGYMAPEQVRGSAADKHADIFAFGAILYEMLTGKRAFQKPTSAETMSAILNEDPQSISHIMPSISPALQRVVHRCLEKNPEQRFQSASDLAFALESLSDSGGLSASVVRVPRLNRVLFGSLWWGGGALVLLLAAFGIFRLVSAPKIPVNTSSWVQITNFPDSVTQPALSPDGRLLTFVHGPYTFAGPGQIYVKMLPHGEPVQLTRDNSQKMSPAFSPDGSRIAYTTVDFDVQWDTWVLPVLGGQPRLWLPNASGLAWYGERRILFSEMKNKAIHMALVSADEGRAEERDVYVPASDVGMAHRSSPSPDGKWAIVVEMDGGLWLPCKLVALDGSSSPRLIGTAAGACTSAAWSPDGKWMYFTSGANGAFHIWRQRFPNGRPEQITSGPTEEEGVAIAPDGGSLITAVGSRQSSVWIHSNGNRQVSLEGLSYDPKFTPDGKRLCYRILKGAVPNTGASELRVVDLDSWRDESLVPDLAVVGPPRRAYDVSADGQQLVLTALDGAGKHRLWLVPLDHRSPSRQIPNVEGDNPVVASGGEIFFRSSGFAYRVREDGTGLQKLINEPTVGLCSISPDGQWLVAEVAESGGFHTVAVPLHQGSTVRSISSGGMTRNSNDVYWSGDGTSIYIRLPATQENTGGRTYAVPLPHGRVWPDIPAGGVRSEAEFANLPGASLLDEFDMPGPTPQIYAFVRMTVQRNLFRVPLP